MKYPELQAKFESALRTILAGSEKMSSPMVLAKIEEAAGSLGIGEAELADLKTSSRNYFGRAKTNEVVVAVGRGPKSGYALVGDADTAGMPAKASPDTQTQMGARPSAGAQRGGEQRDDGDVPPAVEGKAKPKNWESLIHFPATIALANRCDAEGTSLPPKQLNVLWGNPDMLAVRDGDLESVLREMETGIVDMLGQVHSAPQLVLTSVELKYDCAARRAVFFPALAETAANSSWANEALLLYFEPARGGEVQAPDEEAIVLARQLGVRTARLFIRVSGDGEPSLYWEDLTKPEIRPNLSLVDRHADARALLSAAADSIRRFDGDSSYTRQEGNTNMAARLLVSAAMNLRCQTGFRDPATGFRLLEQTDAAAVAEICRASINMLAEAFELKDAAEVVLERLLDAAKDVTLARELEEAAPVLDELRRLVANGGQGEAAAPALQAKPPLAAAAS